MEVSVAPLIGMKPFGKQNICFLLCFSHLNMDFTRYYQRVTTNVSVFMGDSEFMG